MSKISKKKNELSTLEEVKIKNIGVYFKIPILKKILKILTMEHGGYRTLKSMKNINKLFTHIDLKQYKSNTEALAYIWCICYISKQWLGGINDPEIIIEIAKGHPEYDELKGELMRKCADDKNIILEPEARSIFGLITEALQQGYIIPYKEEIIRLLDDIDINEPGAYKQLADRLFNTAKTLIDIKYNTNIMTNRVEFNSGSEDSFKEAIVQTIESLSDKGNIFKTGIKRLNTLLSPGFMNGRIYVYLGLPGSFKSGMLLKSALDIRKYNPNFQTKTPGMKPCVLLISMENTLQETIERVWNMEFDDAITDYDPEDAIQKLYEKLGYGTDPEPEKENEEKEKSLSDILAEEDKRKERQNIDIVIQYKPYKSIDTDDLYTIIEDLREENMEVCVLILDYIKRISPAIPVQDNLRLELDHIMNELKALAIVKNIPVITAHQMNRSAAATVDQAIRQGRGDVNKLVGRENIGDSFSIYEVADWVAVLNTEYRPGTDQKYLTINTIKQRRIDRSEAALEKIKYIAHPFSTSNAFKLIDDINLEKVLSLQSISEGILNYQGKNQDKQNLQELPFESFNYDRFE